MRRGLLGGLLLIVVLLGALPGTLPQARGEEPPDLDRVRTLLEDEKWGEARQVLEDLRRDHPGNGELDRLLGHVYYELGRREDARKSFVDALAHGRTGADVLARLLEIDQQVGRGAAALMELRLGLVFEPDNPAWLALLGDQLSTSGAKGEAEQAYEAAIRAAPSRAEFYVRLGKLLLGEERWDEAAAALEKALALGEESAPIAQNLAELAFRLGDARQAVLWFERSLDLVAAPSPGQRLRLAELMVAAGEIERAEPLLESLGASPDRAVAGRAFLLLGQLASRRGDAKAALAAWETAVEKGEGTPEIQAYLGGHYFNEGAFEKAARYLEHGLRHEQSDPLLLRTLATCRLELGQPEQAREALLAYLERFGLDDDVAPLLDRFAARGD
jgi:tetratricopeptide (TPR) repeat protein